jgi:glucose/arabinose dehydrogenase
MMGTRRSFTLVILIASAACSPRNGDTAAAERAPLPPADCTPLETRPKNAPSQEPAFPAQTRACAAPSNVAFEVDVVASGLSHPWAVEPLPGGDLLVTERPGRLRIVSSSGTVGQPITGLPPVDARGQGGLLDVALSPSFASQPTAKPPPPIPLDVGAATPATRAPTMMASAAVPP